MKKKMLAMLLAVVLIVSLLPLQTQAAEKRASSYFVTYAASPRTGPSSGQVTVAFSISATGPMKRVGVEKIMFYRAADDFHCKTIWGTTGNGMMFADTGFAGGSITANLVAGVTYYCKVTVYAKNADGYDSKTFTTSTVTAKA